MSDYYNSLYQELLGRPVGPADMEAGRWAGHPESTVRTGIMNSAEYRAQNTPSSSGNNFMSGFSAPSGSSSALDKILARAAQFQLDQGEFHFDQFKEYQLPWDQEYWTIAKEQLPRLMYHNEATSEALAHMQRVQASMGNITLEEFQRTSEHRVMSSEAKAHIDKLAASMGDLTLDEATRLHDPKVDLALEGIGSARELLPWETEASRTGFGLQTDMNEMGQRLIPGQEGALGSGYALQQGTNELGQRLLPWQEGAATADLWHQQGTSEMGTRLLPGQEGALGSGYTLQQGTNEMGQRLLPWQEQAAMTNLALSGQTDRSAMRLLPHQEAAARTGYNLDRDQNLASSYLLPQQTLLTADDIAMQRAMMPDRQYAQQQFYQAAAEGVDPDAWAARAGIDVAGGYAGADAALRRDAARMGVDPSSGRFAAAQGGYGLNMAKDLAQARTLGRRAGEDENWQRQTIAAQFAR